MSRENVDLVQAAWETFLTRDPAGLDYLAEDIVYEVCGQSVVAGTYKGREGYLRLLRSWTEVWTEFRYELSEFIDGGEDKVIAVARRSGRSRMTGLQFDDDVFFVYDVRDGKITRIREVEDRPTAFRVVAEETAR